MMNSIFDFLGSLAVAVVAVIAVLWALVHQRRKDDIPGMEEPAVPTAAEGTISDSNNTSTGEDVEPGATVDNSAGHPSSVTGGTSVGSVDVSTSGVAGGPQTREEWVEYATPDFTETAGFQIASFPDDEISEANQFFLVSGDTAEILYNVVPNNVLELRIAKPNTLRVPDAYLVEHYESKTEYDVDGIKVTVYQSPGRRGLVTWNKNGFDYVILTPNPDMNLLGGLAQNFVRNTDTQTTG